MCSFLVEFRRGFKELFEDFKCFNSQNNVGELVVEIKPVRQYKKNNCESADLVLSCGRICNVDTKEEIKEKLMGSALRNYIKNCSLVPSGLIVQLNREIVMEKVIKNVLDQKENYGFNIESQKLKGRVKFRHDVSVDDDLTKSNLTYLRQKFLNEHVKKLLYLLKNQQLSVEYRDCIEECDEININWKVGKVETSNGVNSQAELYAYFSNLIEQSNENKLETNEDCSNKISKITNACVKFNLLLPNPHKPIKLDLKPNNLRLIKTGAFVMYNFARLFSIWDKFDELVKSSYYSPLIPLQDVDFSFLKDKTERALIHDYILWFPFIIEEIFTSVVDSNSLLQFHKLYRFLMNLSHKVSAYYTTIHILGESTPHLLPTMFGRLYLLKSIMQVMKNSFDLLDIEVLNKM